MKDLYFFTWDPQIEMYIYIICANLNIYVTEYQHQVMVIENISVEEPYAKYTFVTITTFYYGCWIYKYVEQIEM